MTRRTMREVFKNNSTQNPNTSIYIWYDKERVKYRYFDGQFDMGIRGIEHCSIWELSDKKGDLEDLFKDTIIMIIPETKVIVMNEGDYFLFADIIESSFKDYQLSFVR